MRSIGKGAIILAALSIVVAGVALGSKPSPPTILEAVKGYSDWKKANASPVRLTTSFDLLCRGITPEEHQSHQKANPHFERFITVYVNKLGEQAMMKGGTFPVGSVVVKEKREKEKGPVVLSTVMIKREDGYNPTCGDWEFGALNADATKTDGEGKLESCMKCHAEQSKNDYTFKTYIGAKSWSSPSGYQPLKFGRPPSSPKS